MSFSSTKTLILTAAAGKLSITRVWRSAKVQSRSFHAVIPSAFTCGLIPFVWVYLVGPSDFSFVQVAPLAFHFAPIAWPLPIASRIS